MQKPTFPITPEEETLLEKVRFDVLAIDDPDRFRENGEIICALTKMLAARSAVPEARIKYFTDPAYFPTGRGKSHQQVFEGNGTEGDDILRHENFVKYFRYFLYGPSLPLSVIDAFKERVRRCGGVTSGDVVPLGDFARSQARALSHNPAELADEFHKLALECGVWPNYCEVIRNSVRQAKPNSRRL